MRKRGRQAIYRKQNQFKTGIKGDRGFSLLEVLVVVGIISILAGILFPTVQKAKCQAKRLLTRSNQRQIVQAVTVYAVGNDGKFPDSVATVGKDWYWNWSEPTLMTGYMARSPRLHRSMSAYLGAYINDVGILACPSAPGKYKYLQESWDAQDAWDNPTGEDKDPVTGNYSFYWNYTGYLEGRTQLFKGPSTSAGARRESKLLVSDYFGYDHWRSLKAYGSCERFKGAEITPETPKASSYWSRRGDQVNLQTITVKFQAGFTDGHVEDYSAANVVPMKAIRVRATNTPYTPGIGPGIYYLPATGL
jgi:prepilin-type N-terminal cleavage/methylation domain-containing protein